MSKPVLQSCQQEYEQKYLLQSMGYDFDAVVNRVSEVLRIEKEEVLSAGRHPLRVKARSLLCFWASRDLGMSMVELSKRLNISQPTASQSATRGEKIASKSCFKLL